MGHSLELFDVLASLKKVASKIRDDGQVQAADLLNATEGLMRAYFFSDEGYHLDGNGPTP